MVESPYLDYCLCILSEKYIKFTILTLEEILQKLNQSLPKNCVMPFYWDYHSAMDESNELGIEYTTIYWELLIRRIGILVKVFIMSNHMATPQEGHMPGLLHIFGYLKISVRKIYLDPSYLKVSKIRFKCFD